MVQICLLTSIKPNIIVVVKQSLIQASDSGGGVCLCCPIESAQCLSDSRSQEKSPAAFQNALTDKHRRNKGIDKYRHKKLSSIIPQKGPCVLLFLEQPTCYHCTCVSIQNSCHFTATRGGENSPITRNHWRQLHYTAVCARLPAQRSYVSTLYTHVSGKLLLFAPDTLFCLRHVLFVEPSSNSSCHKGALSHHSHSIISG